MWKEFTGRESEKFNSNNEGDQVSGVNFQQYHRVEDCVRSVSHADIVFFVLLSLCF